MKSQSSIYVFLSLVLVLLFQSCSQRLSYEPNRESIMQHPTPDWFQEARVGVFIHYNPQSFEMTLPDQFSADDWIGLFGDAGADNNINYTKYQDHEIQHATKIHHPDRIIPVPLPAVVPGAEERARRSCTGAGTA